MPAPQTLPVRSALQAALHQVRLGRPGNLREALRLTRTALVWLEKQAPPAVPHAVAPPRFLPQSPNASTSSHA